MRAAVPGVPPAMDVGVAAFAAPVVAGGSALAALGQPAARPLDVWGFLLVVIATGSLAWLRTSPVGALGAAVVLVNGYLIVGYPYGPVQLCMVVAMFEVARQRRLRVSLLACGVATAVSTAAVLSRLVSTADAPVLLVALWTSWLIIPWSLGALVHVRSAAARRMRRALADRAALEERMRIAGEVHDVAGHAFAVVAMQAGVARLVFDEDPEQAKQSLDAIETTSTKALAELRTMLDAFHRPPGEVGLRGLDALVASVRAGGLPVDLEREGAVDLSADADRTAYRVVQESLTNVLRHAGPTTARVRVHADAGEVVVEVADRGRGCAEAAPSDGRGLTGMRTRVEAVGGRFCAGPRQGGGFRVAARFPVFRSES
jgi:signal transduction histidine kinase